MVKRRLLLVDQDSFLVWDSPMENPVHCLVLHAFHNNHLSQLLHVWPHPHTHKKNAVVLNSAKVIRNRLLSAMLLSGGSTSSPLAHSFIHSFIHAPEIDDDVTHSQQWDRILWPQHWCVLWHSGYSTSSPLPRLKKIWLPSSHLGHSSQLLRLVMNSKHNYSDLLHCV